MNKKSVDFPLLPFHWATTGTVILEIVHHVELYPNQSRLVCVWRRWGDCGPKHKSNSPTDADDRPMALTNVLHANPSRKPKIPFPWRYYPANTVAVGTWRLHAGASHSALALFFNQRHRLCAKTTLTRTLANSPPGDRKTLQLFVLSITCIEKCKRPKNGPSARSFLFAELLVMRAHSTPWREQMYDDEV